ncbi:MAG: low molecular weight protein-tyrosine-phosphatase [Alphaproteobacteria bacterium]
MSRHRLLFICLGNICRSPIAQGVFAHVAAQAGKSELFDLDSAGTGAWHIGNPPDPRARAAAFKRGIDLSDQRARQVGMRDFEDFDVILAMDRTNLADLLDLAPQNRESKIQLFLGAEHDPIQREVPDPYFGGEEGFEEVLDLVEAGSRELLARLI